MNANGVWRDACAAAQLLAHAPHAFGGIVLRASPGPVRDAWMAVLADAWRTNNPRVKVPLHAPVDRLLGGLDLVATLASGAPQVERGLFARAHGGLVELSMAERVTPSTASLVAAVLDQKEVHLQRDGFEASWPAEFGVLAFDEGLVDERPPAALTDRLAIHLDLTHLSLADIEPAVPRRSDADVVCSSVAEETVTALCRASVMMGIMSLRAPMLVCKVACAWAELDGRDRVSDDDLDLAARWVLAPRAIQLPPEAEEPSEPPPDAEQPPEEPESADTQQDLTGQLDDRLVEAVRAALPPALLEQLISSALSRRVVTTGATGKNTPSQRGRRIASRKGRPSGQQRMDVVETLRAAAPWQRMRRSSAHKKKAAGSLYIQPSDFSIQRRRQGAQTLTIFAVDSSGSAALQRMGEAKGAIEHLLAECYVRRDLVALVSFRGNEAQTLVPPTRSLVRARRLIRQLPGGGGTPLAAGLQSALRCAEEGRRRGQTPVVVVLTDGQANVALSGAPGRPQARADAGLAAEALARAGVASLLVDTSARPRPEAAEIARRMNATYLPLPRADSQQIALAARTLAE